MLNAHVKYIRDGLVEQEHYGVVAIGHCERPSGAWQSINSGKLKVESGKLGNVKTEHLLNCEFDNKNLNNFQLSTFNFQLNQPFYLRSCAKPLQASLMIDFGTDEFFGFTEEEIALCCASHAGEKIHTGIAQNILDKIGLDRTYLKCGIHKPLSKTRQNEMLLSGEQETELHNNCSGKHLMMLAICKQKGWDLKSYDDRNHPLQIAIKNKIYELCECQTPSEGRGKGYSSNYPITTDGCGVPNVSIPSPTLPSPSGRVPERREGVEYPVTTDGCGVPIMSVPLENMVKGYLNLFCNPKYEKIKNAFLNNPYVIGGEDRTDTKIIQNSENIVAKVGAGGLCVVVNTKTQEGFVVKIADCDMKARELVVIEMLKRLGWADIQTDKTIKTLHGQIVGEICVTI